MGLVVVLEQWRMSQRRCCSITFLFPGRHGR